MELEAEPHLRRMIAKYDEDTRRRFSQALKNSIQLMSQVCDGEKAGFVERLLGRKKCLGGQICCSCYRTLGPVFRRKRMPMCKIWWIYFGRSLGASQGSRCCAATPPANEWKSL